MRGTRSGAISSPFLLLALSLAILLATGYQAVRVSLLHRRTARQLLHDYAAFAAWSYQRHLAETLQEVGWMTLNPIMHREPHMSMGVPAPERLIAYREQSMLDCRCSSPARPATYFSFYLGRDSLATAGAILEPEERAEILSRLEGVLRRGTGARISRSGILGPGERLQTLLSYGLMPTIRGDTVVYGFTFDRASLSNAFRTTLANGDLLPRAVSGDRPNPDLLSLEVYDESSHLLFRDSTWVETEEAVRESLSENAGNLVIRMAVRPSAAASLVQGGLPRLPLLLLLVLVALAFALAVVALLQLRREGELTRTRTEFVASVSHELRTPLAQIRLFLDTLHLKRYSTDEQRDWLLSHLVRETTRLEHLVDNVLRFSAADRTAGGPLVMEPVLIANETRDTVTAFAPLAASRRATLVSELTDGLVVPADRARFRQLLLNLLDNAVKFGPPGQEIRIELRRHDDTAQLRVSDQGPGIPEADRDRIWEPYYRGRSAQTRTVGGSGIGLAIVKNSVDRMGGRIWVEPAPGGGSSFVVELPLQLPDSHTPAPDVPEVTGAAT